MKKKYPWGPKQKRDAAMLVARRFARFERMPSDKKWGQVEMWVIRAQKHFPLSDQQVRNLIGIGAGRIVEKLQLAGGREL